MISPEQADLIRAITELATQKGPEVLQRWTYTRDAICTAGTPHLTALLSGIHQGMKGKNND